MDGAALIDGPYDGFKRLFVLEADHAKHQAAIAAAFNTEATHG